MWEWDLYLYFGIVLSVPVPVPFPHKFCLKKPLDTSDFLRKSNVSLKRKCLFISLYFIITGQEPKDFTITVTVREKTFQWFSYQFHGNSKNQFPFSICFLRLNFSHLIALDTFSVLVLWLIYTAGSNGYIALCRSFHTAWSQFPIPILTANYRNRIGI